MDREAWRAAVHWVAKSDTTGTELSEGGGLAAEGRGGVLSWRPGAAAVSSPPGLQRPPHPRPEGFAGSRPRSSSPPRNPWRACWWPRELSLVTSCSRCPQALAVRSAEGLNCLVGSGSAAAPVRVDVPPPGGHCNHAGGRSRRCAVPRAGTGDPAPRLRSVPQTTACAPAAQGAVVVDGVARHRGAGDAERERAWSLGVHGPWGSPRVLGSCGWCSCPFSSPSRGTNVRSPCFLLYGADANSRQFGAELQTQMEQEASGTLAPGCTYILLWQTQTAN